eukprot:4491478-Amphidinium_carterae.2
MPHQVLKSCFHALSLIHLPSPAAEITSRHKVTRNHNNAALAGNSEGHISLELERPHAPARSPKE